MTDLNMKRKTLMVRLRWLMAIAFGVALVPATARAEFNGTATVTGAQVSFKNAASTNWVSNGSGGLDLLIAYKSTTLTGSLTLPGFAKARILAVGGGGAGGSGVNVAYTESGAGGGGGGGGVVEKADLLMSKGDYSFVVGAGGVNPTSVTTNQVGVSGHETKVVTNGVALITAMGGGGGGSGCAGVAGASGGGGSYQQTRFGSRPRGEKRSGGAALPGPDGVFQGYMGGTGSVSVVGGGGGGAGGAGQPASYKSCEGGAGKASDITGPSVAYGGGGGGGVSSASYKSVSRLGHDGGGNGGVTDAAAEPGLAGTGGGGGGCGGLSLSQNIGGNGGSGLVIVRLSQVMSGPPTRPQTPVVVTYDGQKHVSVADTLAYRVISGENEGTDAGTYVSTVRLNEGFTWEGGGSEDVEVELVIEKAKSVITDLRLVGWQVGAEPNRPTCKTSPAVEPTYAYGLSPSEVFGPDVPEAAGIYYVRATIDESPNYTGTKEYAQFTIYEAPETAFTDHVTLTVAGYSGTKPSVLTNFPYKVTLAEGAPRGFLYERAGGSGKEMAAFDADGGLLAYEVGNWNIDGESVIYVCIPEIGKASQTITLRWGVNIGAVTPAYDPSPVWSTWTPAAAAAITQPKGSFGPVYKGDKIVNYWIENPRVSKREWNAGEAACTILSSGKLAVGTVVSNMVDSLTGEPVPFPPTVCGVYRLSFTADDPDGKYETEPYHIDLRISDHAPYDDLRGDAPSLTMSGRVLLGNNDEAAGHSVSNQAYWQIKEVLNSRGRVVSRPNPFWIHEGTHADFSSTMPNILDGSLHRLTYTNWTAGVCRTNVLWRLKETMVGNMLSSTGTMPSGRCFLPWSKTAANNAEYKANPSYNEQKESGHFIFRNTTEAMICSPCYTNGIGTIYFDAANAWTSDSANREAYHVVVEVATETDDHLPPTDENAGADLEKIGADKWKACQEIHVLKKDNNAAAFTAEPVTNEVALAIEKGGTVNNFYRLCARLNVTNDFARFRIRRATKDGRYESIDGDCQMLIDNIIVSYPANAASVTPYGVYDSGRVDKQVLGQENAMMVPFPSVGDGVVARGWAQTYTNALAVGTKTPFIQLTRLHYRWRYLNQRAEDWQTVDLRPADDFVSEATLGLPAAEGDVEYWYETFTQMPFYNYYDYSGKSLGLGGLYTEETAVVTNRMDMTGLPRLATCGTDWFFRLRAGKSDWEGLEVVTQGKDDKDGVFSRITQMELISDHHWRGFVQLPTNLVGDVSFHFRGNNLQVPGEKAFVRNQKVWYPTADVSLPARGETSVEGRPMSFPADTASGYVEFQFNDVSLMFTAGHAEYQNFNSWHDAKSAGEKFVGKYAETSGVNVARMVHTNAHMQTWALHRTSESNWNEDFWLSNYDDPTYPKNEHFITHKMPHQWEGENGMFVDADLVANNELSRMTGSGIAWQMEGEAVGGIKFIKSDGPSGLDTVSFDARLSQSIGFYDFAVCLADGLSRTNNYTFVFPALMSGDGGTDYAPGAVMSLVGYYQANRGCYEFRVERRGSDGLQLSIYKWRGSGGKVKSECIGSQWLSGTTVNMQNKSGSVTPSMFGMFISLGDEKIGDTTVTTVIGGITMTAGKPSDASFSGVPYRAIRCKDGSDTRLTAGSFGALTANCNGRFLNPRLYNSYMTAAAMKTGTAPSSADKAKYPMYDRYFNSDKESQTLQGTGKVIRDWLLKDWNPPLARLECCTNSWSNTEKYWGFQTPTSLNQTVDVYLKARGAQDSSWERVKQLPVTTYGFVRKNATIQTDKDCDVMLKAGDVAADVTVHNITQTAWNGEDIANIDGLANDFVYTQARIVEGAVDDAGDGTKVTNHCAVLQPRRAVEDRPLSVRSPLLYGLGMIGFSFKDLQPGCEVWVQVATNSVSGNLGGELGYNQSLKSVELGETEEVGTWITVRRFTYDELAAANGSVKHYLGWHDRTDNPWRGVFRILIPPSVVTASRDHADSTWGALTLTDVFVEDEPALDTKSWLGWNIRTVGDVPDTERRMYLPDSTVASGNTGLSAALNNSYKQDITGDPSEYEANNPYVQSPTFGTYVNAAGATNRASIGQIRFRARLYDTTGTGKPGTVSVYGVLDGASEEWGSPMTNFTVASQNFTTFEYKTPARKRLAAVRLVVDGVRTYAPGNPDPQRVLIEEVAVSERSDSSVGFAYARPFREGLTEDTVIANILEKEQQPLVGESWGVQAKLKLDQFDQDIDVDRGFTVTLRYFVGNSPWGYDRWLNEPAATKEAELLQVGDPEDLVFRSSVKRPATIVTPQHDANTVVQYMLTVYYYEKGSDTRYESTIAQGAEEGDGWTNPPWYAPVDLNVTYGSATGDFSPYTIIDTVLPGRVWINEANYNDGPIEVTGTKCVTNQFIELAVPSGVDLTGWRVVVKDMNHRELTIATLGRNGVPAKKQTSDGRRSAQYDFLVLQSPKTRDAGGIRDHVTGLPAADGTWTSEYLPSTFRQDEGFQYDCPYQLELRRPSDIVEHQFVIAGTNMYRQAGWYEAFGYAYDGTNLLNELNAVDPNPKRFFAGEDLSWGADGRTLVSLGVVGGAHGEEGGWSGEMAFTPGRLNHGQDELEGWYDPPKGESIWVYAKVVGPHLSQRIGEDTGRDTFMIVNSGRNTNIVYTAAPWYQIGSLTVNGVTNATARARKGTWTFNLNNVTETTYVVATEGISSDLTGLGLKEDDRYTPAVMRWLETRHPEGGDIRLATYRGLDAAATNVTMSLKAMYWLDIDPLPPEGAWWLRAGTVDIDPRVYRKRRLNVQTTGYYTNMQIKVRMYLSNDVTQVVYAPYRMQGLGNEQSDLYDSNWTSATFKVEAVLDNQLAGNKGWMPFRWFNFQEGSFTDGTAAEPYVATIEIIDPFSPMSPGYSYGWGRYAGKPVYLRWSISEALQSTTVEPLKADSTYKNFEPWTPGTP